MARGIRRVDVGGFAEVEAAWPRVTAAAASEARPLRVERATLVVSVPSGAHAARARRDAAAILAELRGLVARPPSSLRVVVRA